MRTRKSIVIITVFILVFLLAFLILYRKYSELKIAAADSRELLIPTGSVYEDVFSILDSVAGIRNPELFHLIAKKKKYITKIKPGRYIIEPGMTYPDIIDLLRSGKQAPVNVTFNNVRTLGQLAGKVAARLEPDSLDVISFLADETNYSADGFTRETVIAVFIPDTYQFYWNTDAKGFYSRMLKEYRSFWNSDRLSKAEAKNLDPLQVSTLASIVDEEVAKNDEKPRIAGVYINRLRIGMPLQADPTIRFALNDFKISRVLKKHLLIDSPYNTYKNKGLPPGPVNCPSRDGIESVLNAEDHDYLYFVAKPDFSGYHNFSRTLAEHNRFAQLYQRELNRRRIFK